MFPRTPADTTAGRGMRLSNLRALPLTAEWIAWHKNRVTTEELGRHLAGPALDVVRDAEPEMI